MRHEVTDIAWFERLVNENSAVSDWDFYFPKRVARVIGFHNFARRGIVFIYPLAVRRNPVGIKNDLFSVAEAARQLKILAPDANLISLDLFVSLPQSQLKRGNVDGDVDVSVAGLKRRRFDVPAGEFV